MCLDYVNKQKKHIRNLEARVDGYIWLWKVFDLDVNDNLIAQFQNYNFYEGKNTARGEKIYDFSGYISHHQYEPGFHCFTTKSEAETWAMNSRNDKKRKRIVVPIKVRRTWITATGCQDFLGDIIVCKHIII